MYPWEAFYINDHLTAALHTARDAYTEEWALCFVAKLQFRREKRWNCILASQRDGQASFEPALTWPGGLIQWGMNSVMKEVDMIPQCHVGRLKPESVHYLCNQESSCWEHMKAENILPRTTKNTRVTSNLKKRENKYLLKSLWLKWNRLELLGFSRAVRIVATRQ